MSDLPDLPTEWAISERGRQIRRSENEVDTILRLLALNGGKTTITEEMLLSENIHLNRNTLRTWRDESFPRRYAQIRNELGQEITDETAGRLYERALEADAATQAYIDAAVEKIDHVSPTHLAKNAAALAQATSQTVQTAELLRGRPTSRLEVRSVDDMVNTLERLGVAKRDNDVIDVEVVEEEDA